MRIGSIWLREKLVIPYLRSFRILRRIEWQFLIRLLGQLIRPILEGQGVLDCLTPEDGTSRLFQNFGKKAAVNRLFYLPDFGCNNFCSSS